MSPLMGSSGLTTLLLGLLAFVLITTLMQRPLKKQAEQAEQMRNQLGEGDRVVLTSGLFGTVTHVGNEQLIVELAPGTEVTVMKQAVGRVVAADEEEFEFSDETTAATPPHTQAPAFDDAAESGC